MTEIPEHLLKRAQEARERAAKADDAADAAGAAASAGAEQTPEQAAAASKIPQHLLDRAKAARDKSAGTAVEAAVPAAAAAAPAGGAVATAAAPAPTGPGGHTQRLLTVVKSGSIQDVKSAPVDKVHVWPHLLIVEFVAALAVTAFTLIFSIFVNALVLPWFAGTADHVPSHGGWCDLAWIRIDPADLGAVHRQEPFQQARKAQVRHFTHDRAPHVLDGLGNDWFVLPWPGLQLRLPLGSRIVLRALITISPH